MARKLVHKRNLRLVSNFKRFYATKMSDVLTSIQFFKLEPDRLFLKGRMYTILIYTKHYFTSTFGLLDMFILDALGTNSFPPLS